MPRVCVPCRTFSGSAASPQAVNIATLEPLHSGIAIFNDQARLVFANTAYKKMYRLDDSCLGLDATAFFITARQGILEVLKTGKANSCASACTALPTAGPFSTGKGASPAA